MRRSRTACINSLKGRQSGSRGRRHAEVREEDACSSGGLDRHDGQGLSCVEHAVEQGYNPSGEKQYASEPENYTNVSRDTNEDHSDVQTSPSEFTSGTGVLRGCDASDGLMANVYRADDRESCATCTRDNIAFVTG